MTSDEFVEDGIDIVYPTAVVAPEVLGRALPGLVAVGAHESLRIASDVWLVSGHAFAATTENQVSSGVVFPEAPKTGECS